MNRGPKQQWRFLYFLIFFLRLQAMKILPACLKGKEKRWVKWNYLKPTYALTYLFKTRSKVLPSKARWVKIAVQIVNNVVNKYCHFSSKLLSNLEMFQKSVVKRYGLHKMLSKEIFNIYRKKGSQSKKIPKIKVSRHDCLLTIYLSVLNLWKNNFDKLDF